jgi:poly-gamma-glutamate synthesis protein (capsule biosynthesis protein)
MMTVRGQRLAFLGCTTISGREHEINYVASNSEQKGGAAECSLDLIRTSVAAASKQADVVIFMIHGGYEYVPTPSPRVEALTFAAKEAGATLVINHHAHVVGGFDWDGKALIAWGLGNYLFDQTLWPTFQSYLLAVHIRQGEVVRAYVEPLMIEDYVPKGLTGESADFVARRAASYTSGGFVIEDGAMEINIKGNRIINENSVLLEGNEKDGQIFSLKDKWLSDFSDDSPDKTSKIRLGRDLLWVGSFEDQDVDRDKEEAALWNLDAPNRYIGSEYAYRGEAGVRLHHSSTSELPNVLSPIHRILIEPGTELSVTGMARQSANAQVSLQLSWYLDTEGPSEGQTVVTELLQSNNEWKFFRFDVTVPPNIVAVGLYLRLSPPEKGISSVDFDDLNLIKWAAPDTSFSPLYDHVKVVGRGEAILRHEELPLTE